MSTQDSYVLTLGPDYTVTRDGAISSFEVVGPLVWRITIDGVSKLHRNAMNELSHKYSGAAGAYEQWLEKQERVDGAVRCVCVSNKLSYTVKPPAAPAALNPKKWVALPLESRIDINHNTRRLRFKLPVEDLGLPVGMHIFLKGKVDGKPVMRAYTPVGSGPYYVEFVIKVYFPLPPKFPDGGVLTQHMETLKVGDTIDFKGPLGEFDFDCSGSATMSTEVRPSLHCPLCTARCRGTPSQLPQHAALPVSARRAVPLQCRSTCDVDCSGTSCPAGMGQDSFWPARQHRAKGAPQAPPSLCLRLWPFRVQAATVRVQAVTVTCLRL